MHSSYPIIGKIDNFVVKRLKYTIYFLSDSYGHSEFCLSQMNPTPANQEKYCKTTTLFKIMSFGK